MVQFILLVLTVATSILASRAALGYGLNREFPRPRRGVYMQPQQAMMFSGFYGQPSSGYGHKGSMSTFANRDMVFTHSMAGEEYPIFLQNDNAADTQNSYLPGPQIHGQEEIASTNDEDKQEGAIEEEMEVSVTTRRPNKSKKNKTHKKQKPTANVKPIDEEYDDSIEKDEDQTQEVVPSPSIRAERPSSNTFFPVNFGQDCNSRNGGHPGAAVAIANAFSTGKGGVASSHATAYGDPYFSTLGQGKNIRNNKKKF